MGRLTAKDKVHLAKLKLRGNAKLFYTAQSELRADDVRYAAFRTAFVNRFSDKHTDQYNPYPTAFPYGNGMVLHFYQQQESSTTKTVHKVINKGLKAYV